MLIEIVIMVLKCYWKWWGWWIILRFFFSFCCSCVISWQQNFTVINLIYICDKQCWGVSISMCCQEVMEPCIFWQGVDFLAQQFDPGQKLGPEFLIATWLTWKPSKILITNLITNVMIKLNVNLNMPFFTLVIVTRKQMFSTNTTFQLYCKEIAD